MEIALLCYSKIYAYIQTSFKSFLAGYGRFSVSLLMHTSQEFNSSITSYPVAVTLNQRTYFEARIGSNDTDIIALIEKCSASPTTNRNDPSSYTLVENRLECKCR